MHALARPPATTAARRAAFALNGLIMLLFLALVALLAWRSFMLWGKLPANPRTMYGNTSAALMGMKIGIWAGPIVVPLFLLGVAWLIGWGVSLMFGKSDDAGNIGAALVFLLALGLFGWNAYTIAAGPTTTVATGGSSTSPSPGASTSRPPDSVSAPPSSPNPVQPSPAPVQPRPTPRTPSTPTPNRPTPPTPAAPAAANPAIRPVIDAFAKDLTAQIDGLVAKASKVMPDLARTPPHDLTRIKTRLADAQDLKSAAEALKKALDTADDDLMAKIRTAGVPDHEARHEAFRWVNMEFRAATRGFAADAIVRLCDNAEEECDFLADNIGKWTLDSRGELKSSDIQFKQQAGSKRFFVKAEADRKDRTIDQLKGK